MKWPAQLTLATSQVVWTAEVVQAFKDGSLESCYNKMLVRLDAYRKLAMTNLSVKDRRGLSALIVIEVHARDVLKKLIDQNIKSETDFEWISQMKFYAERTSQTPGETSEEDNLVVRIVNAVFNYDWEYLGASDRLVVTPLTDRCYLTLTSALHAKFGGAPAGPAGTGKTETTKDLAKALGINCVVFNCSDQLDYLTMGKFFKGD